MKIATIVKTKDGIGIVVENIGILNRVYYPIGDLRRNNVTDDDILEIIDEVETTHVLEQLVDKAQAEKARKVSDINDLNQKINNLNREKADLEAKIDELKPLVEELQKIELIKDMDLEEIARMVKLNEVAMELYFYEDDCY